MCDKKSIRSLELGDRINGDRMHHLQLHILSPYPEAATNPDHHLINETYYTVYTVRARSLHFTHFELMIVLILGIVLCILLKQELVCLPGI